MALRVVELFAGVGGFRLGLEQAIPGVETVWFNQWEPSTKTVQHAYDCYVHHFVPTGEVPPPYSNEDIHLVPTETVPDHDLLVGGFPCQDYSVATTLDKSGGLQGKKGVLWWEINRILEAKRPPLVLLENVDRLLRSPAKQRGRDFGVLLSCFARLGYRVEWRVINAADYGGHQRRRRIFIFAAHASSPEGRRISGGASCSTYLFTDGLFSRQFPVSHNLLAVEELDPQGQVPADPRKASEEFQANFQNAGVMVENSYWTAQVRPASVHSGLLQDVLERDVAEPEFYLDSGDLERWRYVKGAKKEMRTAKNGHQYHYAEGAMQFPDMPNSPSRTILTGEAGRTPNRSTHVVQDPGNGNLRFLTPLECERLNGFDDGWTEMIPKRWRYFTMGNALVVPIVTRIAEGLVQFAEAPVSKLKLGQTQAKLET